MTNDGTTSRRTAAGATAPAGLGAAHEDGARTRTITGAGLRLAITERGEGNHPTVVLVHGYPDGQVMWEPVARRLAERYHVVTYDVRGSGASDKPLVTEGYRFPLLMDDLAAVIDATSPDRPVHLVGHDWGSLQGWEAVSGDRFTGRIASYTSINGVPLDHVRGWLRDHRSPKDWGTVVSQGLHSSYIAAFNLPLAPTASRLVGRSKRFADLFHRAVLRPEGIEGDERWPSPQFGTDLAHGIHLYRANVLGRLRRPERTGTDVPTQMIVGRDDPFVPPSLVDGLETWPARAWRRDVTAGHWVTRSHPDHVARWVGELVDHIEGRPESPSLARHRAGHQAARAQRLAVAAAPQRGLAPRPVVVITGAGAGIGRATALAFAARGATVVAADRDETAAKETAGLVDSAGGTGVHRSLDVADRDEFAAVVRWVEAEVGPVDVLVNNAGIGMAGSFVDTTAADWDRIMAINVDGVITGSRLAAEAMLARAEPGHIVNLASMSAFLPAAGMTAYTTTKAAVLQFSEALRMELAPAHIGVSAICPGIINTDIIRNTAYVSAGDRRDDVAAETQRLYERRNLGPEAVARAVLRAVDANKAVVPVGIEAHATAVASRHLPRFTRAVATRATRTVQRRMQ